MATQAERREKTRTSIVKAARRIFGERGFTATTMDDIAAGARVAKGAVYHHFATKEAVFEAVFEQVSVDLVADLDRVARAENDPLAAMAAGTQGYFAACSKGPTGQIILRDGPAVLGWERWREIDARHFGGKFSHALTAAMEAGVIAKQPIEPLARLLLGAVTEAAVAVSAGPDIGKAGTDYARAFRSLLDALRVK
ncbi:TetR/AcrR family transcriptional regulator [Bradyrhizobium sp. ISRA443]|uniref:TetR/AcrR family transcriptional regulator n=1 Tax=unclassified Bradyrhizobium TaxID=2631580 RepID=UPI00247AB7B9|nr:MULTISPECIES: TetR/AcrR family transcriptional regulator [unclassified Bradyrhizobium]WGR94756.1 TetR/AcrR family transcriptional regulator [Bradyrhizobium sp. ISRA435]WGR99580.1 TetR/AcrR family transcriptional regulator [Bradyrhizobium sp. ISRA436]WGS06470.1 TetR/AcrR family transcriptional regulator [Bradyrhizobium sp. ISRA437]WGS13354.1 TetR/AcrR family transcriptional regulator [Bradyrhizobium sp. ISRA443]